MNIIVIFMLYVFYLFIYSLSKYLFTFLFDYLLYQKLHGLLKYQSVIRETMPKPHHYTLHLLSPSQQSQIRFGSLSFFLTKHNRHSHRHLNLIYGTSIKAVLMKSLNLHSSEISNHRKVDQIVKKKIQNIDKDYTNSGKISCDFSLETTLPKLASIVDGRFYLYPVS